MKGKLPCETKVTQLGRILCNWNATEYKYKIVVSSTLDEVGELGEYIYIYIYVFLVRKRFGVRCDSHSA